ncbi:hypothetical protein [Winogradskyella alexanderae]|uniref:Lipoprotein n=1 Tax=Winogradskyella alexanderae TaxID=2877123 RepID=A0ABS7XMQ3_9FLAO|nr:hypothetical protein [Winogradskyella alexanderae]MCA0131290.1 hypothetical protein [Winogradskyella alexanderae]
MKKIALGVLLSFVLCCKNEKTSKNENGKNEKTELRSSYEKSLIDYRDLNMPLATDFIIEAFGMKKVKERNYAFVFKLNNNIEQSVLDKYSVGIRGFENYSDDSFETTFNPKNIYDIEGRKYMICTKLINKIRYFDSLEVFIYNRNNWENSGKLGSIKIIDILFEDE